MSKLVPFALCALLAACSGDPAGAAGDGAAAPAIPSALAVAASVDASASFQATLSGGFEGSMTGSSASSGARYGSYHVSLAGSMEPGPGLVIISLARDDTASPGPGTYSLGEEGDFDGNVELGANRRDFAIESGSLVIARASGDALEGTLILSAAERFPASGGTALAVQVEASFSTRPAG